MENQFIPHGLAVKLKELGFNEPCFGLYTPDKDFRGFVYGDCIYDPRYYYLIKEEVLAPLWQQAFDWIEDEFKVYCMIDTISQDFGVIDCRNKDMKIVKAIGTDSVYKTKLGLKEAAIKFILDYIEKK